MKKISFFLVFFIYMVCCSLALSFCPENSDLISVELPQFSKKINFCQKVINGASIKQGPYEEFNLKGESLRRDFYLENKIVSEEAYLNATLPPKIKAPLNAEEVSAQTQWFNFYLQWDGYFW